MWCVCVYVCTVVMIIELIHVSSRLCLQQQQVTHSLFSITIFTGSSKIYGRKISRSSKVEHQLVEIELDGMLWEWKNTDCEIDLIWLDLRKRRNTISFLLTQLEQLVLFMWRGVMRSDIFMLSWVSLRLTVFFFSGVLFSQTLVFSLFYAKLFPAL